MAMTRMPTLRRMTASGNRNSDPTRRGRPAFEPFQRLGNERIRRTDGHGLGLAIVYAIASAHDAALTAGARPEGGLDIEVSFSASDAQPSDPDLGLKAVP